MNFLDTILRPDINRFMLLLLSFSFLFLVNVFLKIRFFCVRNNQETSSNLLENYQSNEKIW